MAYISISIFNVKPEQIFKWQEHLKPALASSSKPECGPKSLIKSYHYYFTFLFIEETIISAPIKFTRVLKCLKIIKNA